MRDNGNNDKTAFTTAVPVFLLCWFSYASAYFCRVNFTAAIAPLMAAEGFGKAYVGAVAGGFFWAYAAGQLLNGAIGDRFHPRWFVGTGMAMSAVMNLLISYAQVRYLPVLWTLNGFFQSMLWGPIVRTVSVASGGRNRTGFATALITSSVFGSLAAYLIAGRMSEVSWRAAFAAPGAVMLAASAAWVLFAGKFMPTGLYGRVNPPAKPSESGAKPFPRLLVANGLLFAGAASLLHSVVKESALTWGPLMLSESFNVPYQSTLDSFALVPFANLAAMAFAGWLHHAFGGNTKKCLYLLLSVCCAGSVSVYAALGSSRLAVLAALALTSASTISINSILLAILPMRYGGTGRVSGITGFLDCAAYMGAAAASPLTGWLAAFGWQRVPLIWIFACLLGAAVVFRMKNDGITR